MPAKSNNGPEHARVLLAHVGGSIPDYHETVYLGDTEFRDALGRANNNGVSIWMAIRCNKSRVTWPMSPFEKMTSPGQARA